MKPEELRLYDWVQEYQEDVLEKFKAADPNGTGTVDDSKFIDIMEIHGPKTATPELLRFV